MRFEQWIYTVPLRLRSLFRRARVEAELDDELRDHAERLEHAYVARGLTLDEAREAARRTMRGVEARKEECRDQRRVRVVEDLLQDLRYAARLMVRHPGFTAAAVLSLALGLGANTAIFSVIDALVLRPLPVRAPEQLMMMREQSTPRPPGSGPGRAVEVSYPRWLRLREQILARAGAGDGTGAAPLFAGIVARGGGLDRYNIIASGPGGGLDPGQAWIECVSGNYFTELGVPAAIGRVLTPADDGAPGASPVVVISDDYWRRRFARAPDVVGRTLTWNDSTFTIVGVASRHFTGLTIGFATDVWVPFSMQPQAIPEAADFLTNDTARWINVIARVPNGASVDQAAAALNVVWRQLDEKARRSLELAPLTHGFEGARGVFAQPLVILLIVVGLVLLIACVTVANLVLARASARQREMAVRRALGASRARIARQLVTESLLLATCAGALGLVVGLWLGTAAPRLMDLGPIRPAAQLDVRLDARLFAFAAALSALTVVLVGLAPAFTGSRVSLVPALKVVRGTDSERGGRFPLSRSLVVTQVALSLVLLTGAGLFVRTLTNLASLDATAGRDDVLIVWTRPGQTTLKGPVLVHVFEDAAARIATLPGVRAATFSYRVLFESLPMGSPIQSIDGRALASNGAVPNQAVPPNQTTLWRFVGPDFIRTIGLPLIRGRDFTPRDDQTAPRVAIVNERFARQFFGNDDPVGHRFAYLSDGSSLEIVGVIQDSTFESFREPPRPTFYMPHGQVVGSPSGIIWLAVRPAGDTASADLPSRIRETLRSVAPNLAVLTIDRVTDEFDRAIWQERVIASLSAGFALLASLLTYLGLYGVMAFAMTRRTHEIGVRLALGSSRASVIALALRESLLLATIGLVIGIPVTLLASRVVTTRLFGITATDPLTLAAAAALMLAVALLAGFVPARRAARIDPTVALRCE